MNRINKLKPLAPRLVHDRNMQHMTSYSSTTAVVPDGQAGSTINRNAFAGANLGVHASPLEAVTSMDPKDYVWGGGYNTSFQGYQQQAFPPYGEPLYYSQAQSQGCMCNMQYGEFLSSARSCVPAVHAMLPMRLQFSKQIKQCTLHQSMSILQATPTTIRRAQLQLRSTRAMQPQ